MEKKQFNINSGLDRILGTSRKILQLRKEIEKIASCDVTVLISGESGTGKELAARAIHDLSFRAHMSFVPINCGSLPENLFENELFGHRKGAFTDAAYNQDGLVNEAQGGTLFLDEIGTVKPYTQVKLLRLLQEKEYKALGDSKPRKADIRLVAATNSNLKELVENGLFREDLYFRLNVVTLTISPLRERKEDIAILADYFIDKYCREYQKAPKQLTPEAVDVLCSYSWPGNVRELENRIQYLVVMEARAEIEARHLQLPVEINPESSDPMVTECFKSAKRKAVDAFEKEYLKRILTQFNGDLMQAAQTAGKSRTSFWNLLSKHQISPRQFAI